MRTSVGILEAEFAFGGWVLLSLGERSEQFQVDKQHDLAAVLVRFGVPEEEAAAAAKSLWKARPRDAGGDKDGGLLERGGRGAGTVGAGPRLSPGGLQWLPDRHPGDYFDSDSENQDDLTS